MYIYKSNSLAVWLSTEAAAVLRLRNKAAEAGGEAPRTHKGDKSFQVIDRWYGDRKH